MAKKRKKAVKKTAKKAAKKTARKTTKKARVSKARKKVVARKAKKPAAKTAKRVKRARKAKPHTLGERVASAFETVTETLREARALRDKMEPPASSETQ